MRNYHTHLLLFVFSLIAGCVDQFDLPNGNNSSKLVVDGLITNKKGPHKVILSRTDEINSNESAPVVMETDAIVTIISEDGSIELLNESTPGTYLTSEEFSGKIGAAYSLKIELANGNTYESAPEKMPLETTINSLILEFEEREFINSNNVILPINGLNVTVKSNVRDKNELVRLRYTTIHEISSNPELFEINSPVVLKKIPAPKECSGYIYNSEDEVLEQIGPCTCCICYVENTSTTTNVHASQLQESGQMFLTELDFIEDVNGLFEIRFYIEVQQLALTPDAYEFWSSVAIQQENGALFNQPPGKLISNISSLNNPSETVLGYFNVSSIDSKSRFILPQEIPFQVSEFDSLKNDCRGFFNSDTAKPLFW